MILVRRALYIPTDRPCGDAIRHGIAECAELRRETGEECLFLLAEHERHPREREHEELVRRYAREYGVTALPLTAEAWEGLADTLGRLAFPDLASRARLRSALLPRGVAYGSGPNKAAIVAAALGVDVLHRRDSDQEPQLVEGRPRYPGVLEAGAVGRPVAGLSVVNPQDALPHHGDAEVRFVGGTVYGDSPQDRRDVLAAGHEFAVRLQNLTRPESTSREEVSADVERYFTEELRTHHDEDFLELDPDVAKVEMGVSCVGGFFRELPEMPLPDTLGSDYRLRNLLSQLSSPVVYQSRKMRHIYRDDRKRQASLERVVDYALRDLRLVLLWIVSWRQAELIRAAPATYLRADGHIDNERIAASLEQALVETLPAVREAPARFAAIHRDAAAASSGELARRLSAVAEAAAKREEELAGDIVSGVGTYAWLVRVWPSVIAAAPGLSERIGGLLVHR